MARAISMVISFATVALLTSLVADVSAARLTVNTAVELTSSAGVPLVLLPNSTDAVCLDGSPAGYYYKPAPADSLNKDKWIIFMEGGGLCTNPENCYARAQTKLGTSTKWPQEQPTSKFKGPISPDCSINPTFCDYNVVFVMYCDGFLYTGNLMPPLFTVNGTNLYSRGALVRQRVLEQLKSTTTLGSSSAIIISGCSAGGLATYLHGDSMADWFLAHTTATKVRSLPLSGFFLNEPTVEYRLSLLTIVKAVLAATNGTDQLNKRCLAANQATPWLCGMAEFVYSHSTVPTFALNSKTDAWQINCELMSAPTQNGTAFGCTMVEPYAQCVSWGGFKTCNITEARPILWYQEAFMNRVDTIETFRKPGHGAYISSCFTHCEAVIGHYWSEVLVGGTHMNDAVTKWWNGNGTEKASENTYVDCTRLPTDPDYACNPTCTSAASRTAAEKESDKFQVEIGKWN